MGHPIHVDSLSMELSILYFKGLIAGLNFYKMMYFCPFVIWANSADPDEMPHYAAFHQGLHCLPKYLFPVLRQKRFKQTTGLPGRQPWQ